jgi:HSP20 family molecular chaperone IbpA
MHPMERTYAGMEGWRPGTRSFGPHGEYGPEAGRFEPERGYGYGYGRRFEGEYAYEQPRGQREHVWRGGVFGWLGSGLRAGAAWVGNQLQGWGALLGGKLKGTSEDIGRAVRGGGERMGSAMQERGEELSQRFRGEGRPPRSYRRPDDRILDDVNQQVAMAGIDADEVEIEVKDGVVTVSGCVPRRLDKRIVDEIAEQVFGVREVQNHLRLGRSDRSRPGEPGVEPGGENGHGTTYRASPEARS